MSFEEHEHPTEIQRILKSDSKPSDYDGPGTNFEGKCPVCGADSKDLFYVKRGIHVNKYQKIGNIIICRKCRTEHKSIGKKHRTGGRPVERLPDL